MVAAAVHPSCVASLPLHSSPPTPLPFSHFWCKGRFLSSNLYHNLEKKYKAQFPGSPKSLIFWPDMHSNSTSTQLGNLQGVIHLTDYYKGN